MLLTDMLLTQCQTFMHRRNLFGRECLDRCVQAMALIEPSLLAMILGQLSCQELRDVYGFVMLEFPWVLVELVVHAMIIRRMCIQAVDIPQDLRCVEFFAGGFTSGQVAKAFSKVGCNALAFDVVRRVVIEFCMVFGVHLFRMNLLQQFVVLVLQPGH